MLLRGIDSEEVADEIGGFVRRHRGEIPTAPAAALVLDAGYFFQCAPIECRRGGLTCRRGTWNFVALGIRGVDPKRLGGELVLAKRFLDRIARDACSSELLERAIQGRCVSDREGGRGCFRKLGSQA